MSGAVVASSRDQKGRILRFLAGGRVRVEAAAAPSLLLLDGGERGRIPSPLSLLEELAASGLVHRIDGWLELSERGKAARDRSARSETPHRDKHMDLDTRTYRTGDGYASLQVNLAESPLAKLARRKGPSGEPFLSEQEFLAGERLRSDYTRGQIMPRLSANWEASIASSRRGSNDGIGNLTDAALAARIRVDNALDAVGPELSGLLVDICCFLKGIEQVEAERRWPVRSAKLLLKTALAALHRHYEPTSAPRRKTILHWGAADYKPKAHRG